MNRAEIIQTLAMRAGMPQLEAGKFMEIFLRKLASMLVHSDAFFLPSFGSFEVVKPETAPAGGEDTVIIYRPEEPFEQGDQLVFRVPVSTGETSNQLDLYFSMGVNKPLIPLKGQKFVQDDLPTSPLELRKFADYKADAIISKGEIRRNAFGTDYNSIKKRYNRSEGLIGSEAFSDKPASWEFGDDWKKEYEVETLLAGGESEIEDEFPLEAPETTEESGWDFGGDDAPDEPAPAYKSGDRSEAPFADFSGFTSSPPKTKEMEIDLSEFAEDDGEEDDIEQEAADFDSLFKKSLAENMLMAQPPEEKEEEDHFHRVRSTREIPDINFPIDDEPMTQFDGAKFKSMVIDLKQTQNVEDDSFQAVGIKDTIERGPAPKESGAGKWYVLAFILVTIIGSLVYMKLYGIPVWASKYIPAKSDVVITERVPVVVERDYAFPVTYPYPPQTAHPTPQTTPEEETEQPATTATTEQKVEEKSTKQADDAINREMQKLQQAKEQAEKQKQQAVVKPKEEKPEKLSESVSKQVQQFIFTDGGAYQVQVMSVKTKDIADAEVGRLAAKGYKAFVVTANLPGKGTWYRVRVGNFKTIEEAGKVAARLNLH